MFSGCYRVKQHRKGKLLGDYLINNAITYDGVNAVVSAFILGTYTSQNWFFGLIDANSSLDNGRLTDTMDNHPSWQELANYAAISDNIAIGLNTVPIFGRPRWLYAVPIVTPALTGANIILTIATEGIMNGLFISSDYTIAGQTGVLLSTGLTSTSIYLYPEDQLTISYIVRTRTSPSFVSDQRML